MSDGARPSQDEQSADASTGVRGLRAAGPDTGVLQTL